MINERLKTIRIIFIIGDIISIIASFIIAFAIRKYVMPAELRSIMNFKNYGLLGFASILFIIIYDTFELSRDERLHAYLSGKSNNVFQVSTLIIFFIGLYLFLIKSFIQSRLFLVYFYILVNLFLYLVRFRIIPFLVRFAGMRVEKRILIVGNDNKTIKELRNIYTTSINTYFLPNIIKVIDYKDSFSEIPRIIKESNIHWVIFIYDIRYNTLLRKGINFCEEIGISSSVVLKSIFPETKSIVDIEKIKSISLLTFSPQISRKISLALKYTIDRLLIIAISPIVLLLSLPIIIIIKIDSNGSVLFKQKRLGIGGKSFIMYKFRTMFTDSDIKKEKLKEFSKNEIIFKLKNDPRITRAGRYLRKYSIDEIPQFINVLRGEMSIIGPRPHLRNEYNEYKFWHIRRLSMKPGIACLWQIEGRSDIDFNEGVKMDLYYIDNWSLLLDIKIISKMIPNLITGKGAY